VNGRRADVDGGLVGRLGGYLVGNGSVSPVAMLWKRARAMAGYSANASRGRGLGHQLLGRQNDSDRRRLGHPGALRVGYHRVRRRYALMTQG
jgi:hypothetical protein